MATAQKTPEAMLLAIPEPREITLCGGMTDLSVDVRLVTANVAPLYRKTMRTVLSSAGIRVVANKKKFIIDVRVDSPDLLHWKDVPEPARAEYYEIDLIENAVIVRTANQLGALWGSHTLAGIYRAKARGCPIPNMKIRDWPDYSHRTAVLRNLWAIDRMVIEEWTSFIERLAAGKLNALGIPMDGGCNAGSAETSYGGVFAMVPDHAELQQPTSLTWFSPGYKAWRFDTSPSKFHTENFLQLLIGSVRENGLTAFPVLSGLGERTALPRLVPNLGAKNKTAEAVGYCLSHPATRKFLDSFCDALLPCFTPDGLPYVMIHLGSPAAAAGLATAKDKDPLPAWCECPACRKSGAVKLTQEHLLWFAELLLQKGFKQVLCWSELPDAARDAVFSADFQKSLQKRKLQDSLILIQRPAAGNAKGKAPAVDRLFKHWVMPETSFQRWPLFATVQKEVPATLAAMRSASMDGVIIDTAWDISWYDSIDLYANAAWRAEPVMNPARRALELAEIHAGPDAARLLEARELLGNLYPVFAGIPLFPTVVTGSGRDGQMPDLAPLLTRLTAAKETRAKFTEAMTAADKASQIVLSLLDQEIKMADLETARNMMCEAIKFATISRVLDALLEIWAATASHKIDAKTVAAGAAARCALIEALTTIENRRSKFMAPLRMSLYTPLVALVDQLNHDVLEAAAGKRKSADVRWKLAAMPAPPNLG